MPWHSIGNDKSHCIVERILPQLDERRLEFLARSRSIKKVQASDSVGKLVDAYIREAQEGELGALLVEAVILQSARTQAESSKSLKRSRLSITKWTPTPSPRG